MKMKKALALVLSVVTVFSAVLTGCGSKEAADTTADAVTEAATGETATEESVVPAKGEGKAVKMGILVSDTTSAEALAFRAYYEEYIQSQYNVELLYSDELKDAAGEASAIDNFIANNCKAVISLSSFDRPAQLTQCADAGVYYAVATGTLTDEQYEAAKTNEYYVGAIGPDLTIWQNISLIMAKLNLLSLVEQFLTTQTCISIVQLVC